MSNFFNNKNSQGRKSVREKSTYYCKFGFTVVHQCKHLFFSNCDNEETHIGYNIGFVLSGYNIYFGNPIVTRPATIDPGYRLPIYKAEYNGSTTQDQQHCIPEGMSVLSCGGTCVFDFSTTKMNSTKTYLDTLTLKAQYIY